MRSTTFGMRDTGCVFVQNDLGERTGMGFNCWGNKPWPFARDATVG